MKNLSLFHIFRISWLALTIVLLLLTACGTGQLFEPTITPTKDTTVISFYVSPNGNDSWSGTLKIPNDDNNDGPFQTLQQAQETVRALLQNPQTKDIVVYIREGTYYLKEPLLFTSRDSGQEGYQVICRNYPDETPIISGGEVITGWEAYDENIYTTTVTYDFAALFENDHTSVLARYPNQDLGVINPGRNVYMKVAGLYDGHEYEGFYFDPTTFPILENIDSLELRIWNGGYEGFQHWRSYLGPVINLSYTDQFLLADLDGITPDSNNALGPGTDYYIQNALELLDHPGEFYLEGNTLYYWPHQLPIEEQIIVAPRMKRIFTFMGESTEPVRNITLEGLVIRHSDREPHLWANNSSSAAIYLKNAENIIIKGNRIHSIGGRGVLGIADNLRNITIESNLIYDIGDTAVQFNGWDDSELNSHHSIINNHIHHIGLISPHALGLFLNNSSHNQVAHNLFHDIPNTAINISGVWMSDNPGSLNNVIEFNEFHSLTLDFQDMGVIYLGYAGPDNQILNNYIHDSFIPFSFGGGIYMDEYAIGTSVINNLIEHYQQGGNGYLLGLIESGDIETMIQNNIFAYNNVEMGGVIWPREYCSEGGGCPNASVTPPNDIDVITNIFYNNDGPLYNFQFGNEESWLRKANDNIFFNDRDIYMVYGIPGVVTLDDWRALPDRQYDGRSLTADPLFIDPKNGDYRLRFDSPAYALGFEDLKFADMGLREDFPFASPENTLDRIFITSDVAGNSANIELNVGEKAQLRIVVRSVSGYIANPEKYQVSCTSEDNAIASVDDTGLVTANQSGVTLIQCSTTQDGVTLLIAVYVLVDISREEATLQLPPEISPPVTTPFLSVLREINFETNRGLPLTNYNNWRIVEDGNGHIYCGYSDDEWPASVFGSVEWNDYQVEALIRISGAPDASGGFRTRNLVCRDWASFSHQISSDASWQGITQGYCGSDRCDIWKSIRTPINQGEWYVLRAEVDGNVVRTYLNGQLKISQILDNLEYGNIGIFTSSGTTTCVDNIVVRSLDRSPESLARASRGIALQNFNVLVDAQEESELIGIVSQGEEVFIIQWNPDQTWVFIRWDESGLQGWVPVHFIEVGSD